MKEKHSKKQLLILLALLLLICLLSAGVFCYIRYDERNGEVLAYNTSAGKMQEFFREQAFVSRKLQNIVENYPEMEVYGMETAVQQGELYGDEQSSTEEQQSSTEEELTSTEEQPIAVDGQQSSTEQQPDIAVKEKSSTKEQKSSTNKEQSSTEEHITSMVEQQTTTTEQQASTVEQNYSTEEKNTSTEQQQSSTDKIQTSTVTTTESTTEKPKVWHEPIYEDVFVVDSPAGDLPNYESHDICNGCGLDFDATGIDPSAHFREVLAASGNINCGGYHNEMVESGTVHFEETGHWETVLVQEGYWE